MNNRNKAVGAGIAAVAAIAAGVVYFRGDGATKEEPKLVVAASASASAPSSDKVELNETQVKSLDIGTVGQRPFAQQRSAVGSIDFNENLSVQVFPPYQGKILKATADVGDHVRKGAVLYTIDSPDLVQADSTLIAAAGVARLTAAALARAQDLHASQGLAEKDLQQAVSDQQSAEAALKAAREAVRVFGKSEAEINTVVERRMVDPVLVVRSPIDGIVTARAAQPGLLVQPGAVPAPYSIADVSTVWMNANVTESDIPVFHVGQDVSVRVAALPQREFKGKITVVAVTVDPSTRTTVVRSEVRDPKRELRPGMFATFVISTGAPLASVAVPLDGVVREGDGTMSVWVTADKKHFSRKTVTIGLQQAGFDQITSGLNAGEQIVTKGAILLSNMLNAPPSD